MNPELRARIQNIIDTVEGKYIHWINSSDALRQTIEELRAVLAKKETLNSLEWKALKSERPPRGKQVLVSGVTQGVVTLAKLTNKNSEDWWVMGFDDDWQALARPNHQWTHIPLPPANKGAE
jgi:hypothetical protein